MARLKEEVAICDGSYIKVSQRECAINRHYAKIITISAKAGKVIYLTSVSKTSAGSGMTLLALMYFETFSSCFAADIYIFLLKVHHLLIMRKLI